MRILDCLMWQKEAAKPTHVLLLKLEGFIGAKKVTSQKRFGDLMGKKFIKTKLGTIKNLGLRVREDVSLDLG